MYFLTDKIEFPPIETANEYGMVAIGGDLSPERLVHAYKNGIFPWYSEGEPIVWYSPDPRMVLFPNRLKVSKSMRQLLKKNTFKVTFNKAFKEVISNCKNISRTAQGESGTWITDEMKQAYLKLHELGIAKSVEVWSLNTESGSSNQEKYKLVGGLYGLEIGNIFCGESMFSKVSNASKVAFIHLVTSTPLNNQFISNYQLIDCQIYNDHLASLGAEEISREDFKKWL
ncbi:MAG: leucyl/phenylalanyl-tRNA--protein transferase [Flavobacteriaceae bacterium]|nr:leucyl/phenylalanyl-tRNA--protein transferase [Flavobacteriaceae bacterium]